MSAFAKQRLLLGVILASSLPVWSWYITRLKDPSDEPYGALSLAIALILATKVWTQSAPKSGGNFEQGLIPPGLLFAAICLTLAHNLLFSVAPPLFRAMLIFCSLGLLLSFDSRRGRFNLGLFALFLLALPILPSAQFYLGYPVRAMISFLTARILCSMGLTVENLGTGFLYHGQEVWIDAPCSGISMLWGALFFGALSAAILHLGSKQSGALLIAAGVLAIFSNVVRATYLFLLEVFLPGYPAPLHSGTGLVVFATSVVAIASLSLVLEAKQAKAESRPLLRVKSATKDYGQNYLLLTLSLAALIFHPNLGARITFAKSLNSPEHELSVQPLISSPWPTFFGEARLREIPLTERDLQFSDLFPGETKRFYSENGEELVIRVVNSATRRLHPSSDCLKGAGFNVTPQPGNQIPELGNSSCLLATKPGTAEILSCEQIRDLKGNSWSDVSSWYWAALLGRTSGPWISFVVTKKVPKSA